MDIFGADFFPPNFTTQSRINGMEGVNRSIDLVLRVSRDTGPLGYALSIRVTRDGRIQCDAERHSADGRARYCGVSGVVVLGLSVCLSGCWSGLVGLDAVGVSRGDSKGGAAGGWGEGRGGGTAGRASGETDARCLGS